MAKRKAAFALLSSLLLTLTVCAAQPLRVQTIQHNDHQIYLLDVDPNEYQMIAVKASENNIPKATVSSMVAKQGALAGVNGGFFESDGSPSSLLKIDGKWLGLSNTARSAMGWDPSARHVMFDKVYTRTKDNTVLVFPRINPSKDSQRQWSQLPTIVGGLPLLLKDGKKLEYRNVSLTYPGFVTERHARTAFCVKPNNHWLFLVASHLKTPVRAFVSPTIEGLTLDELTEILQEQGCKNAINLDGGGSSTLVLNNKVVNTYAGDFNEFTQEFSERAVSDAILIVKRP